MESLSHPGGNITGVRVTDTVSKALEWLVTVIPGAKKVYLPYNPKDVISTSPLEQANKTADQLGIEIVAHKIQSVEDAVAAIEAMPNDIDAVFRIPSVTLDPRNNELSLAAIKRGIPMGAGLWLDEDVLITFSPDFFQSGKQAARLADQILKGTRPADLPVEASDISLVINLKTAEKIGLHIPDNVLVQANRIIR